MALVSKIEKQNDFLFLYSRTKLYSYTMRSKNEIIGYKMSEEQLFFSVQLLKVRFKIIINYIENGRKKDKPYICTIYTRCFLTNYKMIMLGHKKWWVDAPSQGYPDTMDRYKNYHAKFRS